MRVDGTLTVLLNGVLVQDEAKYRTPVSQFAPLTFRTTEYVRAIRESLYETEAGPLYLQDHDSQVEFRNLWIRPLDDRSHWFDPEE